MNIEAVRAFLAVAEEGQFQHAAALFRRRPSGAALTQDGRTFLPHAGAVDLLRDFCADNPHRSRVGWPGGLGLVRLPVVDLAARR